MNLDIPHMVACTMQTMCPNSHHVQTTHALPPLASRAGSGRARAALITIVVLAAAFFAAIASDPASTPAAALASKQAQAAELDAQVSKLEMQYDELQERFRGAQYELERIRRDVRAAHVVVIASRRDLGVAKVRLAQRANSIYRSGGSGDDLAGLVVSGSFSDFFDRVDTMRRVGNQDADVLVRVEELNATVERKERMLRTAKAQAAKATARAKRDKQAMGSVLDARQMKLDAVNSDIRAIMEAQRREAEARAAAAARETASLARPDETSSSGSSGSSASSGGSSIPLPPGSSTAAAAANAAMGKIGSPYVWAASGPDSFDCSGLVVWAFAQAGRPGLPHSTYALVDMGVAVPMDQLQVGDLVFSASDGHMGIWVGGGSFVHAPRSGDVVKVTSMSDYQLDHARRI